MNIRICLHSSAYKTLRTAGHFKTEKGDKNMHATYLLGCTIYVYMKSYPCELHSCYYLFWTKFFFSLFFFFF